MPLNLALPRPLTPSLHSLRRSDSSQRTLRPAADLVDLEDTQVAYVELPGVSKEDVSIDLEGTTLTISATRHSYRTTSAPIPAAVAEGAQERRFDLFKRSLPVPSEVKEHEIVASLEEGVLRLEWKKGAAGTGGKKVEIQ